VVIKINREHLMKNWRKSTASAVLITNVF